MCTIVYINRDGVCWRLDWRKRRSKRVKRLGIGKLLASDGDLVDALVDDFCLGGWKDLASNCYLQQTRHFLN